MKKRNLIGAVLCSVCLVAGSVVPASADSMRVVTLGADLSSEQKATMLKYFKVNADEVEIIEITNQDEVEHLSSYVPLEQIGTRTVSCAYVRPTQSGGIKVRTANLNWVTCNMIATTLSTSGVKNCEVIAACPFEVSGTGALTGVQMAYERASGEKLDETKKELATEEIVITGNLADEVGQNSATTVINQAKMRVLESGVQDSGEIRQIVVNVAEENGVVLSDQEVEDIVSLLSGIAQQNYEYEEMKETLERVDENVTGEATEEYIEEVTDEESIIMDLDETILGEEVIADSTEDPTVGVESSSGDVTEETIEGDTEDIEASDVFEEDMEEEYVEEGSDEYVEEGTGEEYVEEGTEEITEEPVDEPAAETVDTADTSALSEQSLSQWEKAKKFFKGEYTADAEALTEALGEEAYPSIVLKEELGIKLYEKVGMTYLNILKNGTDSYVADGTELYMSTELNMFNKELKKIFTFEGTAYPEGEEDFLVNLGQEDKDIFYYETLAFFEELYGEAIVEEEMEETTYEEDSADAADAVEEEVPVEEASEEEYYEEVEEVSEEDYYTE